MRLPKVRVTVGLGCGASGFAARVAGCVLAAQLGLVSPSHGAGPVTKRLALRGGPVTKRLALLRKDLFGADLERALAAVRILAGSKGSEPDQLLLRALQLGAPRPLTIAILAALQQRKTPAALNLLRHYSSYRAAEVRVAALSAVAVLPQREAADVLLDALGDSDARVRRRAAELLGQRGERRAEPLLLQLLKKGDAFAAVPLGKVASAETATRLADMAGVLPNKIITRAFGAMLNRPDFGPDPLRVRIVRALGRFSGVEATTTLLEYIASVPPRETRLSKTIAEQLVAGRGR